MKVKLFILSLGFIIGAITFSVLYENPDSTFTSSQILDNEIEKMQKKSPLLLSQITITQ